MKERSALQAIYEARCPRCREGKMFTHGTYNLAKLNSTIDQCSHCGLTYEQEPGFFYGAMYVSYAISVAIMLTTTFVVYHIDNQAPIWVYILSVTLAAAVLYPANFRYSRILFLHIFGGIDYRPEAKKT